MTDDLGVLWEHGRFTDVILHVQGRDIKAHKCILATRSVVFSAMFENDMEEKQVLHPGLGQWGFFRMMYITGYKLKKFQLTFSALPSIKTFL